jgi:hypothetical protein
MPGPSVDRPMRAGATFVRAMHAAAQGVIALRAIAEI